MIKEGKEPEKIREDECSPEGRKGDKPEEVRRACTTGSTVHLTSQVVNVNLPERKDTEKEISPEGWMLGKTFKNKVRRLKRARHQRGR